MNRVNKRKMQNKYENSRIGGVKTSKIEKRIEEIERDTECARRSV